MFYNQIQVGPDSGVSRAGPILRPRGDKQVRRDPSPWEPPKAKYPTSSDYETGLARPSGRPWPSHTGHAVQVLCTRRLIDLPSRQRGSP